jgi:hypothetical protein
LTCINAGRQQAADNDQVMRKFLQLQETPAMTQHLLPEHELEDHRTLRRLGLVIGCFIAATAVMAVTVGILLG